MNENKAIPIRVMLFVSLLFGFVASTVQDVYFKGMEPEIFLQWQENSYEMSRIFCMIFAIFTLYISYTFTDFKFDVKKTFTKFLFTNFVVCTVIYVVSIIAQYSNYQLNILIFIYLFYCLISLIICKIEEKILL